MALVIKYHRCWCWNVRMMIYITLRNVPIGMVDNYIIFFLRIDSQLRAPLQIYPAANIARKCTSPLTGWLPWDFCLFWDVWIDYNGQLIGKLQTFSSLHSDMLFSEVYRHPANVIDLAVISEQN